MKVVAGLPRPGARDRAAQAALGQPAPKRPFADLLAPQRDAARTRDAAPPPGPPRPPLRPDAEPSEAEAPRAALPDLTAPLRPPPATPDADSAAPSRGYRFDELGVFGRRGTRSVAGPEDGLPERGGPAAAPVVALPSSLVNGPAPSGGPAAELGPTEASPAPKGRAGSVRSPAIADLVPADANAVTGLAALPARLHAGETVEAVETADAAAPAATSAGEAAADASDAPRITLHAAETGEISLAAAAPLAPAEALRVWRSITAVAEALGLPLRDFHLNGWAGPVPMSNRRDRNGG